MIGYITEYWIGFVTERWFSIVGAIIGLLFLYLEYKASIWMWSVSIAMAALYIVIFYTTHLYASMGIYIYFLFASVYGWIMWLSKRKEGDSNKDIILRAPLNAAIPIGIGIIIVFIFLFFILEYWSINPIYITTGDALVTSLNIIALWMASRKWAEQWLLVIPANFISGLLLIVQNDYISGFMFLIYFVVSIFGYYKWKKLAIARLPEKQNSL